MDGKSIDITQDKLGKLKELFPEVFTEDRVDWEKLIEEHKFINQVRDSFSRWRQKKKEKEAKVATARNFWVPAINNHGGFGEWAFLEILDPWNTKNIIRNYLKTITGDMG